MEGYSQENLNQAVTLLKESRFTTAFTGAGISVESGIPPFRGDNGLWNKYDPKVLDLHYFIEHPSESWSVIKEIFYDFFSAAQPNRAHLVLARMEQEGMLGSVITQNIDNLHQLAGSQIVTEFHGNSGVLKCLHCQRIYPIQTISLDHLPPTCRECGGLLKPDFIFFGEGIPRMAYTASQEAASLSDVLLIIGTTGEVMPANQIPLIAKESGATIIEINPEPSLYTRQVTDVYLQGKASLVMGMLEEKLFSTALNNDQDSIN
jgi:NAD-dependent deacetylase